MCDAFIRMNRRDIAMISVHVSGTGMHCDRMVYFSADLSLWLDSPMFLVPRHQGMTTYSQLSSSSSTCIRDGVRMCKLAEVLNAYNDK